LLKPLSRLKAVITVTDLLAQPSTMQVSLRVDDREMCSESGPASS
jgi:hypothetical protein